MPIQSTGLYTRKCQECGHRQESKPCVEYRSDAWKDTPCKRCRSSALDYGSFGWNRAVTGGFYREPDPMDSDS